MDKPQKIGFVEYRVFVGSHLLIRTLSSTEWSLPYPDILEFGNNRFAVLCIGEKISPMDGDDMCRIIEMEPVEVFSSIQEQANFVESLIKVGWVNSVNTKLKLNKVYDPGNKKALLLVMYLLVLIAAVLVVQSSITAVSTIFSYIAIGIVIFRVEKWRTKSFSKK